VFTIFVMALQSDLWSSARGIGKPLHGIWSRSARILDIPTFPTRIGICRPRRYFWVRWPEPLRLCIEEVSDDTPRPPSYAVFVRIPSQATRHERSDFRHLRLRLSTFDMFRCPPPEDDSIGTRDRTTRCNPCTGFPRTPRKGARELRQNTQFQAGRYQDLLPFPGIPAPVLPGAGPANSCHPSKE